MLVGISVGSCGVIVTEDTVRVNVFNTSDIWDSKIERPAKVDRSETRRYTDPWTR